MKSFLWNGYHQTNNNKRKTSGSHAIMSPPRAPTSPTFSENMVSNMPMFSEAQSTENKTPGLVWD